MSTVQPVLPPRNHGNQLIMAAVGVGTVWVYLASVAFLILGYAPTPLGYGTALAHTLVPTIVVVGVVHELLGHYWVAEVYCGYEAAFVAYGTTLSLTLGSIGIAGLLVLVDAVAGVGVPAWILLCTMVSPGAVLITAHRGRINCTASVALAAYVLNFIVALGIWWGAYGGSPVLPSASMTTGEALPAYTLVGSAVFACVNAIPVAWFDGAEAFWDGGPVHKLATIVVLIGSFGILISYAN